MCAPRIPVVFNTSLRDHGTSANFARAGTTTDMLTQTTPHILTTAGSAQPAKHAAVNFFGIAESKRAILHEIRKVADALKAFEERVVRQSPQPAERQLPRELGDEKELAETLRRAILSLAVLKCLGRAVEGSFVKLPLTVSSNAAILELMGETAEGVKGAVSAIQRVLEGAWISVRPIATIAARALGKEWMPEPKDTTQGYYVHIGREEFAKAFNVRGRRGVVAYLLYSVGDVEFGRVMARNVKAVAFVGRKRTLRVELLASVVEGLSANASMESVSLWDGEWVRLATLYIDVESGLMHLTPHVEVSEKVSVKPVLGERLTALALTDAGRGGRVLESPDPALHLFYALAVGDVEMRVMGVTFTEAGPTVHFISRTLSLTHVDKLLEEVRRELWASGLPAPGVNELRRSAKTVAVETIGKRVGDIKRIAKEARDSKELRYKLSELFDLVIRKAVEDYKKARDEEQRRRALWEIVSTAVARKFFAENVEDPVWWTLLLLGDGVVSISHQRLGFVAKPGEVAEALLYVLAKALGVPPVVKRGGKYYAYFDRETSRIAIERLFRSLAEMEVGGMSALWLFTVAAEWWMRVGVGGSNQPKLLSLLALRELVAGRVGEWLKTWLSYEAATARMPEAVSRVADEETYGVTIKIGEGSFDAYFEWRGKGFRLHTDLANFLLYCKRGTRTEETLRKFARELRVEPKWHGSALDLPAKVGWALFLRLWHKYNMALLVVEGNRELSRVEVLEVRPDGSAKFRLWYYKWRETRPWQPYVDFELKPRQYKDGGIGFEGRVCANVAEGIYRDHLAEIAELLRRERVRGVAYYEYEKRAFLQFTGVFRDSVFGKLNIVPELPEGEPVAVEYLGGLRFNIGDREVEFMERDVKGLEEFYAELKLASSEGAVKLGSSLRAIHVNTRVVGNVIRLDSDSFFGLLAVTGAVPPGLTPLYRSENFHVYVRVKDGRMRYYFAVKHGGVWRMAKGESNEWARSIQLVRAEREILRTIRNAVAEALMRLGYPADVGRPTEKRDEKGNIKGYRLRLYGHHVVPFLQHAAESVKAEPADILLEGNRIVMRAGGVKAAIEFKLLKRGEAVFFVAQEVGQTLALYKSLKALGVPVELTPAGIKVDGEAMWALVAVAVEKAIERGALSVQEAGRVRPIEVMPGVELANVYNNTMYIFRVVEKGVHYYIVVKTKGGWRAAGGKQSGRQVAIASDAAVAVAEVINAIYRERGIERMVEVKRYKHKEAPYIYFTSVDLELLDIK